MKRNTTLFIPFDERRRSCTFHIDDSVGYYFEHLLFDSLRQNKGKIRIHKIPFFLYWRGISGSLGDRLIEPKCRYWSDFKALYHCMISKL